MLDGTRFHDNHLMLKTEQLDAPKILQSSERNPASRVIVSAFSSAQHLETTYQSLVPSLHTTPWSVNEILITAVVDAKPGTENQTHKLNSKFFGPFVCASQL